MQTEIGKITHLVQTAEQKKTPLQEKLDHFTKVLALFTLSLCAVIFVVGIAFGISPFEMFMTAVSLAVSAVPEGLPAIVTATLAIGVQRMAKKNAIIRHLPAVQTLGTTTVICTDKTGTLTKNEMTVQKIFTGKNEYDITGFGYEPKGEFILKNKKINPLLDTNIVQLLRIANFCNNSVLENDEKKGRYIIGDPTEGALVVLAKKAGLRDTSSDYQRVEEIPFDSERKMMTTIHKMKNGKIVSFSKGAPEVVINKCSFVLENGKVIRITENYKKQILEKTHEFASQAIRVLLLAYKELPRDYTAKQAETGMVFAGLAGMIDPPRKEVPDALKNCRTAGIKVIMITGDHAVTAKAIAEKIGLADGSAKVITGQELDLMTDEQLKSVIRDVNIFARTSAPHKVRILTTLQENGEIVAMTGDGVNDAPALRHADIGIAMYLKGTDVAKEASEMILVDDNFASIVNAVKEGRSIYDNIKKFIRFLLSANFDELFMIITSIMAGLPLPFIPLQILWLNLITDGLPALSLGIDIPEKDTMKRKPRDPNESILKSIVSFAVVAGILNYAVGYGLFLNFLDLGVEKARTVCFTLSVVFELFVAYAARFPNKMFFRDVLTNIKLLISVIVSFCLQLAVIFTPFFQNIFQTVPLSLTELVTIFVSSLLAIFALEFWEALINKEHELRKLFSK